MKYRYYKSLNKKLSILLAAAFALATAFIDVGVYKVKSAGSSVSGKVYVSGDPASGITVENADIDSTSTVILEGNTLSVELASGEQKAYENVTSVTVASVNTYLIQSGSTSTNIIADAGNVTINGTYTGAVQVGSNGVWNVESEAYCSGETGFINAGSFSNYGTVDFGSDSFYGSFVCGTDTSYFYNNGTVKAGSIKLDSDNLISSDSAVYDVSESVGSFVKGSADLAGLVVADRNSDITSSGGSFKLEVEGITRTISEAVTSYPAYYMMIPDIIVNEVTEPIYYGTDIDEIVKKYVEIPSDYDGSWTIKYYDDSDRNHEIDKSEMYPGDYGYRIVSEATSNYIDSETGAEDLSIELLAVENTSCTVTGLKNTYYAQDSITITPPSGYQITTYMDESKFADSLEFTKNDFYPEGNGGNFYAGLYFNFRRNKDKAISKDIQWANASSILDKIIFDDTKPQLSGAIIADGTSISPEDGEVVEAEKVTLTIYDENLSGVAVNGTANEIVDGKYSYITINIPKKTKDKYVITAEDLSGREFSYAMTLKSPRISTTATVDVPDTTEGEDYEPVVTTDSDGEDDATFMYKAQSAPESAYNSTKPTAPGIYMVKATIPETDFYEKIVCESSFEIKEKEEEEETSEEKTTEKKTTEEKTTEEKTTEEKTTEEKTTEEKTTEEKTTEEKTTEEVTTEEPTTEETTTEEPTTEEPTTETHKQDATASVELADQYYGVNYNPVLTSNSDGVASAYFLYANAGTENFTDVKPAIPGSYTVRAVVPETEKFNSVQCETSFQISYLPTPENPYTISGLKGKKDYYIADVYLEAPDGYYISAWNNGIFSSNVIYNPNMTAVYLSRITDGARTAEIPFTEDIKIDTVKPRLAAFPKDQDGKTIDLDSEQFADKITFVITDEHLESVTINGDIVPIKNNEANITLDSERGKKSFEILAHDEAGNKFGAYVGIKATWLKTSVIPPNITLPLNEDTLYKLGSGRWVVGGDITVYNGGIGVYVYTDEDLIFYNAE